MPPRENVKLVGTLADHALRDFLTRADQPYEWFDEESGHELLTQHGVAGAGLPVVVIDDKIVLVRPTLGQLADALGVRVPPTKTDYDVVIVGAGPAGLAAAVYATSDGLSVAVPERDVPGGQAAYTSRIENYFGIDPLGPPMTGAHLARIGGRQAEMFGAELLILRGAVDSRPLADGRHQVALSTGEQLRARALICASGVTWRRLDVPGIDDFFGRGVYFGAGRSEAPLLQGKRVIVVGGGNSAGQAALHLADYAERVVMVCRGPSLAASLSGYLLERIRTNDRIYVRLQSQVTAVAGDGKLEEVTLNGTERLPADAMFIAIGGTPKRIGPRGIPSVATAPATSSPDRTWSRTAARRRSGPSRERPTRSRPASPASSSPATSVTARSSASPPPLAKARPRSPRSTPTSPKQPPDPNRRRAADDAAS
jgi:thioredoxin reductase (NADPH)